MTRALPSASAARSPLRGPAGSAQPAPARNKTIPFDYQFVIPLTGEPGHRAQDVVSISVEGPFVAVALGYSVVPDAASPARSFEPATDPAAPREPTVTAILFPERDSPSDRGAPDFLTGDPQLQVVGTPGAEVALVDLESLAPDETSPYGGPIELGDKGRTTATLSTDRGVALLPLPTSLKAGLGPTLQAVDTTNGLTGGLAEIHLGRKGTRALWTPTLALDPAGLRPLDRSAPPSGTIHLFGTPTRMVHLFVLGRDRRITQIASETLGFLELEGGHTGHVTAELTSPLGPGDTLGVRYDGNSILATTTSTLVRPRPSTLTLGSLAAGLARAGGDLTRGFRLAPGAAGLLTADPPLDELGDRRLAGAFLTGCHGAEEASFLYSIDTVGSGRELQNAPIHNLAGLGIADGDRPFRPFARPVVFEPRSSIRFQVEELSGPAGTLYVVLQGYKVLGSARPAR